MNFVKKLVGSKIVVFNLITTVGALLALPEVTTYVDPSTVIAIQGIVTIVLRLFFSTPTPPATPPAA